MDRHRRDSLQVVLLPFEQAPVRIPQAPVSVRVSHEPRPERISWTGALALAISALLAIGVLWQLMIRRKRETPVEPAEPSFRPFDAAVQTARESVLADPARAASVIRLWVQSMNQAGLEKSAVLLMAVGEAAAGHILRYLNPTEVTQLAETMRRIGGQSRDRVAAVLADFQAEAERQTGFGMAPQAFLGEALSQALGEEKAAALLARLEAEGAPLKQLAWMAPAEISHLLGQEPAPVIATVLAHLERTRPRKC